MAAKIVVVGSCMIDLNCYSQRLPKCGETLTGDRFSIGFGGKGANQCVAAARIGGPDVEATLVARVGDDTFGADYLANLRKNHIDTEFVKTTAGLHSGVAQISVSASGDNTIVIVPGANTSLSAADVQAARGRVVDGDVALFQFETPIATTLEALALRRAAGKGISIVNAAPAVADPDPAVYTLSDIFCVNETEAEALTGVPLGGLEAGALVQAAGQAADELIRRGCSTVVLTLGAHGAVVADRDPGRLPGPPGPQHVPTKATRAVDTTGAGDAFLGALAYFLGARKDLGLLEQVHRAMLYATMSVEKPGTQDSFPFREDLPAALLKWPRRVARAFAVRAGRRPAAEGPHTRRRRHGHEGSPSGPVDGRRRPHAAPRLRPAHAPRVGAADGHRQAFPSVPGERPRQLHRQLHRVDADVRAPRRGPLRESPVPPQLRPLTK